MKKFCYVSNDFKNAWRIFFANKKMLWDTSWVDESVLKRFFELYNKENSDLKKYSRPANWYLNDLEQKDTYLFPMAQSHFNGAGQKYEYTEGLPSLKDILLERAADIRDQGKPIEILYSGGIDSSAVVLAFNEVCPKDQLKIWMAGDHCITNNKNLFDKIVSNLEWEMTTNLNGCCDPSKNVFTSGNEADRLFGADGYTQMMGHSKRDENSKNGYKILGPNEPPTTDHPDNWQWNQDRWWGITSHTYLTQSWRMLRNVECDKIVMDNFQPLFFDKRILQYAINIHMDGEMKWYNSGLLADPQRYKEGKIWVRNFVYEMSGDKEYSYNIGKTLTTVSDINEMFKLPLAPDFNVLGVMDDGTVVNRDNMMEYMTKEHTLFSNAI